jgi:2-iminobutanoate/2-iminopropanoate deaminase
MVDDKPKPNLPLSRFRIHADTVYVSGQVPIRNGAVVSDDFAAQAQATLENLKAVLTEAGTTVQKIVKCNCYLRRESDMVEFNRIYREFFGDAQLPARTTLIADPPNPKVLVEVEAIAALK